MAKGKSTTVKFDKGGIGKLPKDKPIVYKIKDQGGENIYTGSAKRGRVDGRLKEHLPGATDAIRGGARVQITQFDRIREAQKQEQKIIAKDKPNLNK